MHRLIPAVLAGCLVFVSASAETQVVIGLTDPNPGRNADPGELETPFAVAFEDDGDMLIVEYTGGRVLRRTTDGQLQILAGGKPAGYVDGPGDKARFNDLHNLVLGDNGLLYLSEHKTNVVRVFDRETKIVRTLAGTGKAGDFGGVVPAGKAQFNEPISIAAGPGGTLLVADIKNRKVRQIDLSDDNHPVSTIAGNGSKGVPEDGSIATDAPLVDPRSVAMGPGGEIFIAERNGNALRVIRDGEIFTVAGTGKKGRRDGAADQATFNGPKHIDVAPGGMVYIADDNNDAIRIYDPATQTVRTLDTSPYVLNRPHGVKVHGDWLYIADSFHHRVLRTQIEQAEVR